jgi:hypothetical protein
MNKIIIVVIMTLISLVFAIFDVCVLIWSLSLYLKIVST